MGELSITPAVVDAAGGRLVGAAARAALGDVQGAAGASGEPAVDGAIEAFVAHWGSTVAALQEATAGLGHGAQLAADAYVRTDRDTIVKNAP